MIVLHVVERMRARTCATNERIARAARSSVDSVPVFAVTDEMQLISGHKPTQSTSPTSARAEPLNANRNVRPDRRLCMLKITFRTYMQTSFNYAGANSPRCHSTYTIVDARTLLNC